MASETAKQAEKTGAEHTARRAGLRWLLAAATLALVAAALGARALAGHAALNAGLLAVLRSGGADAPAQQRLAAAERNLQRALDWSRNGASSAHAGLALVSERHGAAATAAEHWRAAGYKPGEMLSAAQELFQARQFTAAAAWFERVALARPADASVWELLVLSYTRAERWPRALDAAERGAAQLGPTSPGYSNLQAWVGAIRAERLGKPDLPAALQALNEALQADRFLRDNARVEALATRADVLRRLGRGADAISDYEQALAVAPQSYWPLCRLGSLYWSERRDADAAEAALRRAITLRPDYTEAYYRLATVYRANRRSDEAIEIYRMILSLNPKEARAQRALQDLLSDRDSS